MDLDLAVPQICGSQGLGSAVNTSLVSRGVRSTSAPWASRRHHASGRPRKGKEKTWEDMDVISHDIAVYLPCPEIVRE